MQRPRKKFGFLKQILEEELVEPSDEQVREPEAEHFEDASSGVSECTEHEMNQQKKKNETTSEKTKAGPSGVYPVHFSTLKCRNEACQTRLSSFPMFPVSEDTVWISDGEGNFPRKYGRTIPKVFSRKKKTKLNSSKSEKGKDLKESLKPRTLITIKNDDGTRKEFGSEHLLKQSKNPAILAWLHQKNRLLKQQRRVERREKREKRFSIQEERRQEFERHEESEKRVKEWMKMKRHDQYSAALVAAAMMDKNKITPKQEKSPDNQVPPNYRVVKSFKCQFQPDDTNNLISHNTNDKGGIKTRLNKSTTISTQCRGNKVHLELEHTTNMPSKIKSKLVNTLKSQSPLKDKETSQRPKTVVMRPKTASARVRDTPSLNKTLEGQRSPEKMQSMSYDEWLKCKRDGDKKRTVKQKRELVDSHLEKVILEIGKERVRKIRESKKHIDTGLKNFRRMPDPTQGTHNKKNVYEWITEAKSRPEPQGCALPDSDHADKHDATACGPNPEKLSGLLATESCGVYSRNINSATPQRELDNSLETNSHLNCKALQPSKEKVKSILNTEKQKLTGSTAFSSNSKQESKHCSNGAMRKQYNEVPEGKMSLEFPDLGNLSTKNLGRSSARPALSQSDKGLTPEQVRKVEHDMDILGLLEDFNEGSNTEVMPGGMSTVRDDYFDYGSEVDTPHMKSNKFVNPSKRQSLDFQII